MPTIETQGLSKDCQTATGDFETIQRGDVSRGELLDILIKVSKLSVPQTEDHCPPTINTILTSGSYTCFYGDGGIIRCADSKEEEMTPEIATSIICNDLSIQEYDLSKGYKPKSSKTKAISAVLILIAAVVYIYATNA